MLKVVVSDRLDTLADALAVRLAESARPSLFGGPTIVVPNRGIDRWLSMQLASRFGVWVSATFPFPEKWLHSLASSLGFPTTDPNRWSRGTMECALYDLLRNWREPEIQTWIGEDPDGRRTLSFARQVALCFDQYAAYRPELLLAWEDDRWPSETTPPPKDLAWQAHLWRALVARLGPEHPARVLVRLGHELAETTSPPPALSEPLHVFGVSSLPPLHVDLLATFGRIADATVWVFNPCREMWFEAAAAPEIPADTTDDVAIAPDATPSLLALNGRLGRDFLAQLYEAAEWQVTELWSEPARDPPGALGVLRRHILDCIPDPRPSDPKPAWPDDPTAPSIAVHICHSPRREIEVLRDRLLDLFDRKQDLTPRDVLVMAPEIELYAPHIAAVFSAMDPPLPYSIADRSPLLMGHIAEAVRRLLRLPDAEVTAPELFDLLSLSPVRLRFSITDDQLDRIRDWIRRAAIRRGGDQPDRLNSWRSGLERLTLGAMVRLPPLQLLGDRLPVEINDTASLDALWAFWTTVCELRLELTGPHTPAEWHTRLLCAMDRLLTPSPEEEPEYAELRSSITRWNAECSSAGLSTPLPLTIVREMIERRLDPTTLAAPFLSGGITFCNLRPMRSVPFRVIALLGMNDTDFPRRDTLPHFSLIRRAPRRGDHSRRLEDRQLFIETMFAVRDHLHISYIGRDARTNEVRPPSVCVSELLDALNRTFAARDRTVSELVTIEHSLQPFSPLYFSSANSQLFTYSARVHRAAAALGQRTADTLPAIFSVRLPPPLEPIRISLDDLIRFARDPVADWIRRRLNATIGRPEEELSDTEPWPGFDELPRALLRAWVETSNEAMGHRTISLDQLLVAAGHCPAGTPGRAIIEHARGTISALLYRLAPLRYPPRSPVTFHHTSPRGITLDAIIPDLRPQGLIRWTVGPIHPTHVVEAWLTHLVLNAADPAGHWRTHFIGHSETLEFAPIDHASILLDQWLATFADGLCQPLLLWPDCALDYVKASNPDRAANAARAAWSNERGTGLRDRRAHLRALIPSDYDIVTAEFLRLAELLYRPLIQAIASGTDTV